MSGLSDEDRATVLAPCDCGHDLNFHGDLAGCWTCDENGGDCSVSFETLLAAAVATIRERAVNEALTEAADFIDSHQLDAGTKPGRTWSAAVLRARAT